ncbi:hypothetical protein SprV_0200700800 [Sparganum proliferum]
MIPNTLATFHVHVVRSDGSEGRFQNISVYLLEINLPSKHYFLSVTDKHIADLDPPAGATITALVYGQTTVTLLDRNVEDAISSLRLNLTDAMDNDTQLLAHHRRPTSIVNVVEPAYFRFTVEPYLVSNETNFCTSAFIHSAAAQNHLPNQWTLETGKTYQLIINVFDQNNHKIYSADNQRISITFSQPKVEIISSTSSGSMHVIRPLETGAVTLKAKLTEVFHKSGRSIPLDHPISGSQDITIFSSVSLLPSVLNLAWNPSLNDTVASFGGAYALHPSGGSGEYTWAVLEASQISKGVHAQSSTVAIVSSNGEVVPRNFGTAVIVVSDLRNPDTCSYSIVNVSPISNLAFSRGRVEVFLPRQPLSLERDRLKSALQARQIETDLADLTVTPVPEAKLRLPMSPSEKNSNAILTIGLTAVDADGNPLTACHSLPIRIHPTDPMIVKVLPGLLYPPPTANLSDSPPCAFFRVIGLREGFTELEASYVGASEETTRSSSLFPVAVYRDIEFLGGSLTLAVAVGSSLRISHIRGPQPWPLDSSRYFADVRISASPQTQTAALPKLLQVPHPITTEPVPSGEDSVYSFVLRCEASGRFDVDVLVGNDPSRTNVKPTVLSAPITLLCEVPSSLSLIPQLHLPVLSPGLPACPFANRSSWSSEDTILVTNKAPLRIELIYKGPSGLELFGTDSLMTVAHLSTPADLSEGTKIERIITEVEPPIHISKSMPVASDLATHRQRSYFHITPRLPGVSAGTVFVKVVAKHEWPSEQSSVLAASLSVRFSPPVTIYPPNDFQLLYHTKAAVDVHLADGSGFFHLSVFSADDQPNASVPRQLCLTINAQSFGVGPEDSDQSSPSDQLHTRRDFVLSPKCLGRAILKVTDVCFPDLSLNEGKASLAAGDQRLISVVGLGSLRLYAPSQIELNTEADAFVRAFDTDGNLLPSRFASLIPLNLLPFEADGGPSLPSDAILGLPRTWASQDLGFWAASKTPGSANRPGIAVFRVRGQAVGSTRLRVRSDVNTGLAGAGVLSNAVEINIFSPLKLEPCNFNLLLGGAYEVYAFGGPQPRSLDFSVSGSGQPSLEVQLSSTSTTENSVLVRAGLGSTGTVVVKAKAFSTTGYANLDVTDFDFWNLSVPTGTLSSESTCPVNLVALSGIRIGCPLRAYVSGSSGARDATGAAADEAVTSPTGDSRILIASRRAEDGSYEGGAPVWAEGIVAGRDRDRHQPALVTPMGMSDLLPPLRFSWRLTPPMPSASAELVHWLSHLDIEPDETNLVSGMVLVGLSPGQVRLQLTVFTEDESLTGQLVSFVGEQNNRRVKPVSRLSKELLINVIPRLSLAFPPRMNPQILMSPRGRLQIRLPPSIATESSMGLKYSIDCPSSIVLSKNSSAATALAIVSASGLLEAGAAEACNGWSTWRAADCSCLLRVSFSPSSSSSEQQQQQSKSATQSLAVAVVVKSPRYVLARAQRAASMLKSAGLPFGGPYPIALSFHDELGEAFDAVADEFMGFHIEAHRSNLVDYYHYTEQRSDAQEGSWPPRLGLLMVRLVPPLHATDSDVLQTATTLNLRPGNTASAAAVSTNSAAASDRQVYFSSSYVTLPTGPQLKVDGVSEFVAGQWTCLPPMPQGPGLWSSSDPTVLWIDNESGFMLPLRAGRVHLLFSPTTTAAAGTSQQRPHRQGSEAEKQRQQEQAGNGYDQPAFLGRVNVLDFYDLQPAVLKSLQNSVALTSASQHQSSVTEQADRDSLLTGGFPGLEFGGRDLELQFTLGVSSKVPRKSAGVRHMGSGLCASSISRDRLDELAKVTPFACAARLHTGNEPAPRIPTWLRAYLLAERYVQIGSTTSGPSLLPPLSLLSVLPTLSDSHFTAHLTPNTGGRDEDTGTWVCSVRYLAAATSTGGSTSSVSTALDPYAMLASLLPGARLVVQVFDANQPSSESAALATAEVPLTPPFRLIVPPVHLSSQVHLLLSPRSNTANLLVFVPPATLARMEATQTLLKARSLRPDVLAIYSAPRPVASVEEDIRQALARLADSPLSAVHVELMMNISRLVENEAEVSTEQALGGGLVWTIGLRSLPTKVAMDLMVEVVVSLRTTGQHVSVPVRVLTRSLSDAASGSVSEGDEANAEGGILGVGFWTELPWMHFILLIFVTWVLLLAAHLVTKTMNVNGMADTVAGSAATKSLPPLPTAGGTSMLWTQGFGQPGNRYSPEGLGPLSGVARTFSSPTPIGHRTNTFSPTPGVRAYGDSVNDQRTTVFRGSSPSRLREAFDNSL